jgi:hypothetical protein
MTTFHPDQSGLRDNHTRGTVADFLHEKISDGSKLSIVSAYFTIYAYDALKSVLDRLRYLEANRSELEESVEGVYAVVPPKPDVRVAQPGVLFCLRHRIGDGANLPSGRPRDSSQLNPLAPYYLVYILDDGTVRFTFAQPKQTVLLLLRDLAADEPQAFEQLCSLFDARTSDGADMSHYDELLRKALASIESTFQKRATTGLPGW